MEIDAETATVEFNKILQRLKTSDVKPFLNWLKKNVNEHLLSVDQSNSDIILESIRTDLRASLPLEAVSQTENIHHPKSGPNADCDPRTSVHVDAFLYDEGDIDDLCDEGKLSRNYCVCCMSRDIKPLTFITHSASVSKLKYIFQYLLPDLRNKTVLDIGSRTGALLYGAHLYSESPRIIGVEIDTSFCELQMQVIDKYKMSDRIQVMHDDIMRQEQLLQKSDVVIMNNVFEFFADLEQQRIIWSFLRKSLRQQGTVLITSPSVEESLQELQTGIDIASWLKQADVSVIQTTATEALFSDPEDSDIIDVFMYQVTGH